MNFHDVSRPMRFLPFLLLLTLTPHLARASSDFICEPTWSLHQAAYDRCSNLPLLSPGNDTQINLKLLFVDGGLATVQAVQGANEESESGYAKVPFSLKTFNRRIFTSAIDHEPDSAEDELSDSRGESSRCLSNETGTTAFVDAVEKSKDLTVEERRLLTESRQQLAPDCAGAEAPPERRDSAAPAALATKSASPAFKEFAQYLVAAAAFYEGRYDEAEDAFTALAESDRPWLQETASYMLGRTDLNRSQRDAFDEYGFPDLGKVDKGALEDAESEFDDYLQEYPGGIYARSARGLLRRVYWLSGQQQKLAEEYVWQWSHAGAPQHNLPLSRLAQEADDKLLVSADPAQIRNPLLLATVDLALMRSAEHGAKRELSLSDLQRQKPLFAGREALFDYLRAVHLFYVEKDAAGALKEISGDIPKKMTYLDFSRLVLRGMALETVKDHAGAQKLWLALLPAATAPLQFETLQLALALNYEYSGTPEKIFASGSPITESTVRAIVLRNTASADLLRKVIAGKETPGAEREIALFTLLFKDLLRGHYGDYIKDYPLLPADVARSTPGSENKSPLVLFGWTGQKTTDSYDCPSTLAIAERLAKDPQDTRGLICLGDFANANGLDPDRSGPPDPNAAVTLGFTPSHFPGAPFARGEAYKKIIANPQVEPDLKAYALHRAIRCYAPSGYNHCGGDKVAVPVRKSWFQTLKTRYPRSTWATSLKYYW